MTLHFKDVLNSFVEDDHPQPVTHAASPAQVIPAAAPTTYTPDIQPLDTADQSDGTYQRLAAKTDWEKAPVFAAIKKYLAPMEGLAIDEKTKFSIALKQAQAQDGIDPAAVIQNFETVKAALQNEATVFAQNVANKITTDVDAKTTQAQNLQAQVQQLTEEAFSAKQRLDTAKHKFDVAFQTRLNEINQAAAKYASLLA